MSTYINNRLFAYSYLPIDNQEILNNYVNSLILIGSEQQLYQPLTKTYVGIGKTAYNNLLQQLEDSLPLFNSTNNFVNHNFYLLSDFNNIDNENNKQSYFNNNLYFNFDNNNNTYLNSSYFKGWLNGTSTYSLYSYNSDQILVSEFNNDNNIYNNIDFSILFSEKDLPYDAEVEYLKSTGTQWINTPWTPDLTKDFKIETYAGWVTTNRGMLISAYGSVEDSNNLSIELYDSKRLRVFAGGQNTIISSSQPLTNTIYPINIEYTAASGECIVNINNNDYTGTVISSGRILNNSTANLGTDKLDRFPYGMFGRMKIYNPDLIVDFIPVRIGQTGYIYDKVSGELFGNQGTGDFILGPDIFSNIDQGKYKFAYINDDLQYYPLENKLKSSYFEGYLKGTADNSLNTTYSTYSLNSYVSDIGNTQFSYISLYKNTGYQPAYINSTLYYDKVNNNGTPGNGTLYTDINGNADTANVSTYSSYSYNSDQILVSEFNNDNDIYNNINFNVLFSEKSLPYDAEIEYLETTGTQYIDTEILPNINTIIKTKFINLQVTGEVIIGTRANGQDNKDWRLFNYNSSIYFDALTSRIIGSSNSLPINTLYNLELGNYYVKDLETDTILISGNRYSSNCDYPILISPNSRNKFYYVQIYQESELILDLIPVRIGQTGYMYDKVSGELFENQGTGDFILGPDIFSNIDKGKYKFAYINNDLQYYPLENKLKSSYFEGYLKGSADYAYLSYKSINSYNTDKILLNNSDNIDFDNFNILFGNNLPYNEEIEYLESDGNQWIDTLISGGESGEFLIDLQIVRSKNAQYPHFAGSVQPPTFPKIIQNGNYLRIQYTNPVTSTTVASLDLYNNLNRHVVEYKNGSIILDDNIIQDTLGLRGFGNTTFALFIHHGELNTGGCIFRIYKAKLWKDGELVRDFIPVKKEGIGYLYDKVSKQLFENQGTGDFILGPENIDPYTTNDYVYTYINSNLQYKLSTNTLKSSYFEGYLKGTADYSNISYDSNKILVNPVNESDKDSYLYNNILFVSNQQSIFDLPYDSKVEYLESSRTQYIDTGVSISNLAYIKVEMKYSGFTNQYFICGCRTNYNSQAFVFSNGGSNRTTYNQYYINYGTASQLPECPNDEEIHTVIMNNVCNVDGEDIATFDISTQSQVRPFWLFGGNNNDSLQYGKMRIYYCKIYQTIDEEEVLIRDFVPVRIGNIGYMYDNVTSTLFKNSGTGNFILGDDIGEYIPLEYLESTGTQWINTGIKLLENATGTLRLRCKGLINKGESFSTLVNVMKEVSPYPGFNLREFQNTTDVAITWSTTVYRNWKTDELFEIDYTGNLSGQSHDWPLTLFCSMQDLTTPWRKCFGKLYYLQIDINGETVVDFIPVRIGQTGYMYNKLSGQLFGNEGTGEFSLGPDIQISRYKYTYTNNNLQYNPSTNTLKSIYFEGDLKGTSDSTNMILVNSINESNDKYDDYNDILFTESTLYTPYDIKIGYLESTGTQYIDTGITSSNGVLLEFTSYFSDNSTTPIIGSYAPDNKLSLAYSTSRYVTISKGNTVSPTANPKIGEYFTAYFDTRDLKYTLKWNGSQIYNTTTANPLISTDTIKIFTYNGIDISNSKFRSVKITDNNEQVLFDAIPVRKGSSGYLYDKISNKLFGNSGTGEFSLGEDIIPIEYLQSNGEGSRYVTDFILQRTDTVEVKAGFDNITARTFIMGATGSGDGYAAINTSGQVEGKTSINVSNETVVLKFAHGTFDDYINRSNMFNNTGKLSIFSVAAGNTNAPQSICRIYYLKVRDSHGMLIHDIIPVRIGEIGYFYDQITDKLFSNNGVAGNTVTLGQDSISEIMTEVEYLESNGTQYIDIGIIPDSNTGAYAKITCFDGTDIYFFGLREDSGNTRWGVGHQASGFYYCYGNWGSSNMLVDRTAEVYLNYLADGKYIALNGGITKQTNLPALPFTPTKNIFLFGNNYIDGAINYWKGKFYAFKLTQESEVIMDLIPVRMGNSGYMYDKISGRLFGNQGTGEFIIGPAKSIEKYKYTYTNNNLKYNPKTETLKSTYFDGTLLGNSIYASYAQNLKNNVHIWGQQFNGANDVTGDLDLDNNKIINTGSILPYDENSYIGYTSNEFNFYGYLHGISSYSYLSYDSNKILTEATTNNDYHNILFTTNINNHNNNFPYDSEIEYLESTGTQYIDTGIISQNNLIYDFKLYETVANNQRRFFGFKESNTWTGDGINDANWGSSFFYVDFAGTETNLTAIKSQALRNNGGIYHFDYTDGNASFSHNGIELWTSDLVERYTGNKTVYLFAMNYISETIANYGIGRIYYFKITKNNNVILDLIPVRIGTTGYMYDKVSGQLFGNQGTGEFILGPDISTLPYDAELEYLDSTVGSYINISEGYDNILNITRYICDFQYLANRQQQRIFWSGNRSIYENSNQKIAIAQNNDWKTTIEVWSSRCTVDINTISKYTYIYNNNVIKDAISHTSVGAAENYINIFCGNNGSASNYYANSRFWNFKAYVNDELYIDLIPVRVGSIGYLYDKISEHLFENSGTGDFVLGPDKTLKKYKYLYINEGLQYNPSNGTLKSSYFNGWLQGTADNALSTIYSTYSDYSYNSYVSDLGNTQFTYIALYKGNSYQPTYIYSSLYYDKVNNNGTPGNGTLYTDIYGNANSATNANNSSYAEYAEQLKTEVNIWGQPFDGSSNITGDLDLDGNKLLNVSNISPNDSNATIGGAGNKQFNTIYSQNFEGLAHDIQKTLIPASNNVSYSIILGNASNTKLWYYNDTHIKQTEIFTKKSLIVGTSGSNITNIPRSTLIYDSTNNIDYITDSIYSNGYQLAYKGFIHYGVLYNEGNINNANNYILLAGGGYMPVQSLNTDYAKYSYNSRIYRTEENQTYYITFSNTDINGNYSSTYVDTSIKYNPLSNKLTIENGSVESYFIGNLNGKSQESYFSDNSTYSNYSYNSYVSDLGNIQFTYIALYQGNSYQPVYIHSTLYYDKVNNNGTPGNGTLYTDIRGIAMGLNGGTTNQIAYQTSTNNTGFIDTPTNNTYLKFDGSKFVWTSIADTNTWRPIKSNTDTLADSDTLTLLNGSGITLTYTSGGNITIAHTNNITAGITKTDFTKTIGFGGTINIPIISYDAQGHITSYTFDTITLPSNPNTDEYVRQWSSNDNKEYKLLFTYTDNHTSGETSYIKFDNDIKVNPSTNTVYASYFNASYFNGWLSGTANNAINSNYSDNSTYSAYSYNSYVSDLGNNQFGYIALYQGNSYQPVYIHSTLYYDKVNYNGTPGNGTLHTDISGNASTATNAINSEISTNIKGGGTNQISYQSITDTTKFIDTPSDNTYLKFDGSKFVWTSIADTNTWRPIKSNTDTLADSDTLTLLNGSGITLTYTSGGNITINHSNIITNGTIVGSNSTNALNFGDTINIPSITYDANGHITSWSTTSVKLPNDSNIDEKVKQIPYAGDGSYYLLFAYDLIPNENSSSYVKYNSSISFNTNTHTLSSSYFDGWLKGTADNSTYSSYSHYDYVSYINDNQFTYIALYKGGNSYQPTYIYSNLYYDKVNNNGTPGNGTLHTDISGNAESAKSAVVSTNLNGGNKNSIPYQTAANTTDFITAPDSSTSYYSLTYYGTSISWQKEEELNVTTYRKTSNINITWDDFVNLSTDPVSLNNGTYIIQLIHGNIIYSGILSYRSTATGTDEIILHASGNPDNRLYLRTNGVILQISSTKTNLSNHSITIKLRRII